MDYSEPSAYDRLAIEKLNTEWLDAMRTKDVARLLEMVTEDVVFLPPGYPPIRGKKNVEAMYHSFFPQFASVEQTVSVEELQVAGDWAFVWGTEALVLVPQSGSAPIEMSGRGMSILRRQPDNSWKFARGINNSAPRPAPRA